MPTALQKMQKARAALILDQPFFGSLALRLQLKPDPATKTVWTDGITAGFNPAYVDEMPMEQLKASLCIQVMRLAAQHHCRRGGREQGTWDRAGEMAVTSVLKEANFVLPKNALVSSQFKDKEAEAIYTALKELEQKQGGGGQGQGNGQGQQPPPQGDQQPGQQPPGAGGQPGPGQAPDQGNNGQQPPQGCGEVRDYPGKDGTSTQAEKEQQAQDWKIATQQAAQQAKACGKLPGNLLRLVEQILEPVVDWKEALRQFIERTARNDYTWTRPNQRYFSRGLILPSLYTKELPPIVVAVDTSGSISQDDLKQFAGEIDDILNQYPAELYTVYIDTKVRHHELFTAEDRPIKLEAKGGGGTRFSPAWQWVAENIDQEPACLVYLTDLESNDFGQEPDYPVLWIATGRKDKPPFGECIKMKLA